MHTSAKMRMRIYKDRSIQVPSSNNKHSNPDMMPSYKLCEPTSNVTYHADEETRLLRGTPDTSVTDDTDGEASSETRETDGQTGTELDEALVQRHLHFDYSNFSKRSYGSRNHVRSPEIKTDTTRP